MATQAIRTTVFLIMAGVGPLSVALMSVPIAHAQMVISKDGVTFPDDTEQTRAAGAFGNQNTRVGAETLSSITPGPFNTATGYKALRVNTGQQNTANGVQALSDNLTGDSNTAIGAQALFKNTSGSFNTATGGVSLFNNDDGTDNAAYGVSALGSNTSGSYNTAIGGTSLFMNTSGDYNIAVGYQAGVDLTDGDYNIAIGNRGVAGESGTTRIGTGANHTKTFIAGISGVTTDTGNGVPVVVDTDGQLGTIVSSRRYKEDISKMTSASAPLLNLRPVTFRYKKSYANGEKPLQYGLIAEEVAEEFPELVVFNDAGQAETVKYQLLSTLLLNELQKQNATLRNQELQLAELKAQVAGLGTLVSRIADLSISVNDLAATNATH